MSTHNVYLHREIRKYQCFSDIKASYSELYFVLHVYHVKHATHLSDYRNVYIRFRDYSSVINRCHDYRERICKLVTTFKIYRSRQRAKICSESFIKE